MADYDTDEWDKSSGSFAQVRSSPPASTRLPSPTVFVFPQHAVAGSIAGLAEHSVMFPMDTIKTVMQVRQTPGLLAADGIVGDAAALRGSTGSCPGVVGHWASLTKTGGVTRMWRGVQTMFTGCIPAHAAYFTVYEGCKAAFNAESSAAPSAAAASTAAGTTVASEASSGSCSSNSPFASGAAVGLATMCHDVIMTPMDCIKQRLQLGYHSNSVYDCACAMFRKEGPRAFMLSYPTTLLMNVPYALIMGTANEAIRNALNPGEEYSLSTYISVRAAAPLQSNPYRAASHPAPAHPRRNGLVSSCPLHDRRREQGPA